MRVFTRGSWCFVTGNLHVLKFERFLISILTCIFMAELKADSRFPTKHLHRSSIRPARRLFTGTRLAFSLCSVICQSLSFFLPLHLCYETAYSRVRNVCALPSGVASDSLSVASAKPCGSGYVCGEVKEKKGNWLSFLLSFK